MHSLSLMTVCAVFLAHFQRKCSRRNERIVEKRIFASMIPSAFNVVGRRQFYAFKARCIHFQHRLHFSINIDIMTTRTHRFCFLCVNSFFICLPINRCDRNAEVFVFEL